MQVSNSKYKEHSSWMHVILWLVLNLGFSNKPMSEDCNSLGGNKELAVY